MIEGTGEFFMELIDCEAMDVEYEFDAPRFFDFSLPETDLEAEQAERWFDFADSDPPSPFIIKLNLGIDFDISSVSESCGDGSDATICTSSDCGATVSCTLSTSEENFGGSVDQCISKAKVKSITKPTLSRCSTLMKPTASHLAKLNQTLSSRRNQKSSSKNYQKTGQLSLSVESPATKRQKLEAGYLHKVAQVKQQLLLLHKVSKKTGSVNIISVRPKPKVTVPKEPVLVTARRAEMRRSKGNEGSPAHALPNARASKASPLNRKVLQHCLSLPKKTTSRMSEFHGVRSSLSPHRRITAHSSDFQGLNVSKHTSSHLGGSESRRRNTVDASKQEKCRRTNKLRSSGVNMKELKSSREKSPDYEPPVELLSKLSLGGSKPHNSRSQSKLSLHPKGSKENTTSSFQRTGQTINAVKGKSERLGRKQLHCGSLNRIPQIQAQTSTYRSFKIC